MLGEHFGFGKKNLTVCPFEIIQFNHLDEHMKRFEKNLPIVCALMSPRYFLPSNQYIDQSKIKVLVRFLITSVHLPIVLILELWPSLFTT